MFGRRTTVLAICLLALLVLSAPDALAAKPPKPTPTPPPAGKLFFFYSGDGFDWSMNADGTDKTSLAVYAWHGESASHSLHGGYRWFLYTAQLSGEYYPDGTGRVELYAAREGAHDPAGCEGCVVQLTDDPTMHVMAPVDWMRIVRPDQSVERDLQITFYAEKWDGSELDPNRSGTYITDIRFDADGYVIGLGTMPDAPVAPGIRGSWAPDASRLVHEVLKAGGGTSGLAIYDVAAGTSGDLLVEDGVGTPRWSPEGSRIAFKACCTRLQTIRTDGTDRKTLVTDSARNMLWGAPQWSPTGSHLAYNQRDGRSLLTDMQIYRIANDGSGKTNLTKDMSYSAWLGSWRE